MDVPKEPWLLPFDNRAGLDDILACFRLILGRRPHREEWVGHSGHAGSPLREVVSIYLNSLEFSYRGMINRTSQPPAGDSSGADIKQADLGDYLLFADANDMAVGRHALAGAYDPYLTGLLRGFLKPGMGMIDIGANIGVFALLAASRVGEAGYVLAVEPNPSNTRLLEASRRVNGFANLVVCQAAADASIGLLGLHASNSNGTTSAITDAEDLLCHAHTVPALRVDDLVPLHRRIDLIKIDVEGAEHKALLGTERVIREWSPVILSEFSPELLAGISGISGPAYLQWLMRFGYRIGIIGRDATIRPPLSQADIMQAYHASGLDHIDIICLPPGVADDMLDAGAAARSQAQ